MDQIDSIWLLLSSDAALICNEPKQVADSGGGIMSFDLFKEIIGLVKANSWKCTILANRNGIPAQYQILCDGIEVKVVLPAEHNGTEHREYTTMVFGSDQMELVAKHAHVSRAILRVKRYDLPHLSEIIDTLLNSFSDVSIRHPELLSYNDKDMVIYKEQLFEIGKRLLERNKSWTDFRIDCLTDRFRVNSIGECGAGVRSMAVGPTGELHLCTATIRDGGARCGHILTGIKLPNRHLLTRPYSLPCGKCDASHCSRCVYLNKHSTGEFCVPSKNVCVLANYELEVQAWFAREALATNIWDSNFYMPSPPLIHDPFEVVKVSEETPPIASLWRQLVKFDGRKQNLEPSMMLDIIHNLQAWSQTLVACANAGCLPTPEIIEKDILSNLRRQTIESYRDLKFGEECPTVHQIELLACTAAKQQAGSSFGKLQ
jgi:CXXX repeat peptide maturase